MFCIACGRQMSDEERFCSQCGTRRAVIPADADATRVPTPPARLEQSPSATAPATLRPVRSTAEIMPIRMPLPTAPPPAATTAPPQELTPSHSVVPWPEEESDSPALYSAPEAAAVIEPEVVRPAAATGSAFDEAPARTAEARSSASYASVPFAAPPGSADVGPRRGKISPVLIGAVIVALLAAGGIVWMLRSSVSTSAKAGKVEITIFPVTAKVVAGKGADFAATVNGAPSSEVTWKVEEGDNAGEIKTRGAYAKEGAISLYATYTAPKTPGTYHLVATSTADPSKSASAEITVVGK
jgi:zinc-ribbon domain